MKRILRLLGIFAPNEPNVRCGRIKDATFSDKILLVTCPHASNITGTISPIRKIANAVHVHPRIYCASWFMMWLFT
ncbi:Pyridoxal phosphate-dependent transferase major region subdomain 1 [Penicillium citrinum]|uniref:Pyridoxal phosphate-dependent transferase major region subdomain 1 n=1 Tax=Penicillium citrinum TaxID=5077 RepID=A0A9W9PFG5_PENCI|nr:Pyridoxal phosphate-dependent transferase major region subdomain 1 [Penicillium citrinum]KAJ5242309.1 Pyridoxal phosphate-dependent transferase major region subdomain 1 [Penicillium citrinum]